MIVLVTSRNADEFHEQCKCLECLADTELPVEIEEMRERMADLKEGLRSCLSSLNGALRQGTALLDILVSLEEAGTLDSRPHHIRLQAQLGKSSKSDITLEKVLLAPLDSASSR